MEEYILSIFNLEQLRQKNRKAFVAIQRHLFCYLMYKYCGYSSCNVGRLINRNHATVLNSIKVINDILETKQPKGYYNYIVATIDKVNMYEKDITKLDELLQTAQRLIDVYNSYSQTKKVII
jgi:hypothetical protein